MKPLQTKTHLVRILFFFVAATFILFSYLLSAKTIPFYPSLKLTTLENGEQLFEVLTSTIPLSHVGLFLGFVLLYLNMEFYGFKSALYGTIGAVATVFLSYGLLLVLFDFALDTEGSRIDYLIAELFRPNLKETISFALSLGIGFFTTFFLATFFKKITRDYFMFIRYPLASLIGFFALTFVGVYISFQGQLAPISMVYEAIPWYSHFAAMILVSVIPLYILRILFGFFRGRSIKEVSAQVKPVFKTSDDAPLPLELDENESTDPKASIDADDMKEGQPV